MNRVYYFLMTSNFIKLLIAILSVTDLTGLFLYACHICFILYCQHLLMSIKITTLKHTIILTIRAPSAMFSGRFRNFPDFDISFGTITLTPLMKSIVLLSMPIVLLGSVPFRRCTVSLMNICVSVMLSVQVFISSTPIFLP